MRSVPPAVESVSKLELLLDQIETLTTKTRRHKKTLQKAPKYLSFSVFVSLWFSLPPFLIDRTSFTQSVAGGEWPIFVGMGMTDGAKSLGRGPLVSCEPTRQHSHLAATPRLVPDD
jgi:hypothetical protein